LTFDKLHDARRSNAAIAWA